MASSSSSPFSRARLTTALTSVQHVSALVFGTFLFVHLAAPSTAVVAGSGHATDLATKTMILGRVYYQNIVTEPIIVYGAALVHVLSGVVKRVIQTFSQIERQRQASASGAVEPYRLEEEITSQSTKGGWFGHLSKYTPSIHTATGVLLAPALAIHVALNRLVPIRSHVPIHELSPSELDYGYVAFGFDKERPPAWRYITYIVYALLLGAGSVHVVAGTDRIAQRSRGKRSRTRTSAEELVSTKDSAADVRGAVTGRQAFREIDAWRKKQRKSAVTAAVSFAGAAWLAVGITRMVKEGSGATGYMAKRMEACYAAVWPYSIAQ